MVDPICRSNPDSSVNPQSEIAGATNLARILQDTGLPGLNEMEHPWLALVINSYTAYLNALNTDEATKQLTEFSKNLEHLDLTNPAYKRALSNMRNLLVSEIRHPENCDRVDKLLAKINAKLPGETGGGELPPVAGDRDRFHPPLPKVIINTNLLIGGLFGTEIANGFIMGGDLGFILTKTPIGLSLSFLVHIEPKDREPDERSFLFFAKPSYNFFLTSGDEGNAFLSLQLPIGFFKENFLLGINVEVGGAHRANDSLALGGLSLGAGPLVTSGEDGFGVGGMVYLTFGPGLLGVSRFNPSGRSIPVPSMIPELPSIPPFPL